MSGYPSSDPTAVRFELRSEFATVELSVDDAANGPRLRVKDMRRNIEVLLDPMQLEALTRMEPADLFPYMDPSTWGRDHG